MSDENATAESRQREKYVRAGQALTVEYGERVSVLTMPCWVGDTTERPDAPMNLFLAIWDTGATNSLITQKVADACGLKPFGQTTLLQALDTSETDVYKADILLPDSVLLRGMTTALGDLSGKADVLIGMDIIGLGDFAVSHPQGMTKVTFSYPASADLDFTRRPENESLSNSKLRVTSFPDQRKVSSDYGKERIP